ncbi:MAG: amino acid permease [Balneolaceae bacterium]
MKHKKLAKELSLFDVYAISTGAMFSSGFFLLPGLASAVSGPAVVLAYLIGGIMVLPAMLSAAELSTAMPRAGGPYYFLDRSLGPMIGTIGGLGTWFALIFKSAFALIGMGAYLAIFVDLPIKPVAISLTLFFMFMNIVGVKKTSGLQGFLVVVLVTILIFFVVQGLFDIFSTGFEEVNQNQFIPFMPFGYEGLISTVGLIFVSYAGLTQVASVAEEVQNPDRNIPLGMILSLLTATIIYVLGVYVMVGVLDAEALREDLTPVATAAQVMMDWLPYGIGLILVVIAAIAAFASTGNAGIMSAARYPLAMARDKLLWKPFTKIGRFETPTTAIVVTAGVMIFFILVLNVADIAKLASAFMLLIFGFLNLAVIIMRESKIEEYDPGFHSPFYPWTQVAGMLITIWLISEMGIISVLFTMLMIIACMVYYYYFAYKHVKREGAIYHVHARLGQRRDEGLEHEMRNILREKGLRDEDPYEEVVSRAGVMDVSGVMNYSEIVNEASRLFEEKLNTPANELYEAFTQFDENSIIPIADGVALNHSRIDKDVLPEMVLVRVHNGLVVDNEKNKEFSSRGGDKLHSIIFLLSPQNNSGQHLRIIAQIAEMVGSKSYLQRWLSAENKGELREILLRDERFIHLNLSYNDKTKEFIGQMVKDINLPGQSLITIIRRGGQIKIPHGITVLQEGDELSIIGELEDIKSLNFMLSKKG